MLLDKGIHVWCIFSPCKMFHQTSAKSTATPIAYYSLLDVKSNNFYGCCVSLIFNPCACHCVSLSASILCLIFFVYHYVSLLVDLTVNHYLRIGVLRYLCVAKRFNVHAIDGCMRGYLKTHLHTFLKVHLP